MDWTFERVAGPFTLTEGPVWDGAGLLFSDIRTSRILRYDPATGGCRVYRTNTHETNGLFLDRLGYLYACEGGGRRITRYGLDGSFSVVLADRFEGKRLNSPNDIVVDARGRVWFSDPRYGDKADDLELSRATSASCAPTRSVMTAPSALTKCCATSTRTGALTA